MDDSKNFGNLIRKARTRARLDQHQLGEALGRDGSFVSRLETGRSANPPDAATLDALGRALGLSRVEMLTAMGYLDNSITGEGEIPLIEVNRLVGVSPDLISLLASVDLSRSDRQLTLEGILQTWLKVDIEQKRRKVNDDEQGSKT